MTKICPICSNKLDITQCQIEELYCDYCNNDFQCSKLQYHIDANYLDMVFVQIKIDEFVYRMFIHIKYNCIEMHINKWLWGKYPESVSIKEWNSINATLVSDFKTFKIPTSYNESDPVFENNFIEKYINKYNNLQNII